MKFLKWFLANAKVILGVLAILGMSGTFTITGGIKKTHDVLQAPGHIKILYDTIAILEAEIHHLYDNSEMVWQFARLMTDNPDTLDWWYVDDYDIAFPVDIRHNAEMVPLAFVYNIWMIYPVYFDPAENNKMYVIVHDNKASQNQNYNLFVR